jgi:hypothetical protein
MFWGKRVLIVGDSHVAGPPGQALEELLYAFGADSVHRIGQVGWGPQAWQAEGLGSRPEYADTVLLWFGSNDAPTASTANAMDKLGRDARAHGAEVWWIGAPSYARPDLQERSDKLADIARKIYGRGRFVDSRPLTAGLERAPDGVHFRRGPGADTWAAGIVEKMDRTRPAAWVVAAGMVALLIGVWGATR